VPVPSVHPARLTSHTAKHVGNALALVLILWTSGLATAQPQRSGFTLELSTRVGGFSSFQIDSDNVLEPAIAPLSIGMGGFVSERLAILGVLSTLLFTYNPQASSSEDSRIKRRLTRSIFLGVLAQLWLTDTLTIESGLGCSTLGNGPIESLVNRGVGVPVRVSWSFAETPHGSLSGIWELMPTFFSRGEATLSSTVGLRWQWL
jgi:hypothetical protein